MLVNDMDSEIKFCPAKRCSVGRYKVTIWAPNRRYCSCGAKLKKGYGHSDERDEPLLVDTSSDNRIGGRVVAKSVKSEERSLFQTGGNSAVETKTVGFDTDSVKNIPTEPITWQHFKGTYAEHGEYLEEFKSGDFKKYDARGNKVPQGTDTFTCEEAILEGCPLLKNGIGVPQYAARVPWDMYQTWVYLCRSFNTEWIAYLKGTKEEDGSFTITDMYFPKQKANGAHVDAEDNEITEGTIGAVHSHVGMSAFFSAEDKKHANHAVEIVCNRSGELAVSLQVQLKCGSMSRHDSKCLLTGMGALATARETLSSQLTEKTYGQQSITTGEQWRGGGKAN